MLSAAPRLRRHQRGLSLVELMVGITIGLIVVAATTVLFSAQLGESRRLIAEAQVQQDLRASADIIARELRRSGNLGLDWELQSYVWATGSNVEPLASLASRRLSPVGTDDEVTFEYYPSGSSSVPSDGFGFSLDTTRGVLQTRLVAGGWQDLTDPATMLVTEFAVTRLPDIVSRIPCATPCPSGDTSCWPSVNQRNFEIRITARHRTFPEIERTHESRVRLRNDHLEFFSANPTSTTGAKFCPS